MKKKPTRKSGPNLKVIGLFVLALALLTLVLFSEGTKPCVLDVPDSSKFVYDPAMAYANPDMTSLRVINVQRALILGGTDLELFGNTLVSTPDPKLDITLANVNQIIQVSYPFTEQGVTVNVLNLKQATKDQITTLIATHNLKVEQVEAGISIYTIRAHPAGSDPNKLENAFIALAGSDFYYVEGFAYSLRMLAHTLEIGLKGDSSYVKTDLLMRAYALLTGGMTNIVGFSYTQYKDKANGVEFTLKAVAVDSGQVTTRQVLVFGSQKDFDTNSESAKGVFLERNDRTCSAGQFLTGTQVVGLDKLRTALQGL